MIQSNGEMRVSGTRQKRTEKTYQKPERERLEKTCQKSVKRNEAARAVEMEID